MPTKPSHRKRPPRPSNRLPKNLYAVLGGDLSSLRATVGDLSRQIGSGSHATKEAARGAKGASGKRLESTNLPFAPMLVCPHCNRAVIGFSFASINKDGRLSDIWPCKEHGDVVAIWSEVVNES